MDRVGVGGGRACGGGGVVWSIHRLIELRVKRCGLKAANDWVLVGSVALVCCGTILGWLAARLGRGGPCVTIRPWLAFKTRNGRRCRNNE